MDNYNIISRKGDTWDGVSIEVLVNGSALNLTNATISMEARISGADNYSLLLTNGSGITITSPTSGIFQIDPIIFPMEVGVYSYDVSFDINGRVKTYLEGTISILLDAHYAG